MTETEEEISRMLNGKNGNLPVYNSLKIFIPNGIQKITKEDIGFLTKGEIKGKRDITSYVECKQQENLIYRAKYELKAISEDMIIKKIAKNIQSKNIQSLEQYDRN